MPKPKTASTRRAKRRDKLARWVITLGGVTVIASVIAILALIVGVTLPLFRAPRANVACVCPLPALLPSPIGRGAGGEGGRGFGAQRSRSPDIRGSTSANSDSPHPNPLPTGEGTILRIGIDASVDGRSVTGFVWSTNGTVAWVDMRTGELMGQDRLPPPGGANGKLCGVEPLGAGKYSLSWSGGAASLVEIVAQQKDGKEAKAARYAVRSLADISTPLSSAKPRAAGAERDATIRCCFIRRSDTGAITRAALLSDGTIALLRQAVAETPTDDEEVSTHEAVLREDIVAHVRAMTMDREGNTLYAGTDNGRLLRWQLDEKGQVANREVVRAFPDGRGITALALVLGDVSLAVGDAKGDLTVWSPINTDGTRKLQEIHRLTPHASAVREILPSGRNKSIASLDADGVVHLDHTTSERHLLTIALCGAGVSPATKKAGGTPAPQMAIGGRGDALLGLDVTGTLTAWQIDSGCPEISFKTLFGKVQYEGYDQPEYAWQTTGGEDFEAKYSLVPLIFGTLKGTFYAVFFAVPLALFGAMYVSYFTTPGFRRMIKPLVEIMATVPSVVIGFLIALWLAPIIETWILAFFTSLIVVPATFVVFMILWQLVRRADWARRVESGYEFLVVLPVLLLGVGIAVCLAMPLESWFFDGNFRQWLFRGPLGMQYDQRNNIIIAFGLGFTVIPIIFSISEDSLSNVPYSMTAASMAVGASRWQTLWRVVLPSASPGIFAAMMIGFGRAVGETMIVLMATGNTPILSCSPLNGMRTLSANIAVEIPEAPVGGTLYRVLFLCAVLLFVLTFIVNTLAELVRQRLRKRFGRF
jgi:phosphate transport system permease protein